jgi:endonuclease G
MKRILLLLLVITFQSSISQKLRDEVIIKSDIFEITYSEILEQPKTIKYIVKCPDGNASRAGMDFYTNDSIVTSNADDYVKNIYDKGHMAPAADFNCTTDMLRKTFSYLNCSLQNQDLNRVVWRLLEAHERGLAKKYKVVEVSITCVFSKASIKLPSGATVPDGYYKTITYDGNIEKYYFKNEKPKSSKYELYRI